MFEYDQADHAPMPLYYLHIKDGAQLLLDPEGSSLPNLEAARAVLAGNPLGMERSFQIDDADGQTLLSVSFRDAINSGESL